MMFAAVELDFWRVLLQIAIYDLIVGVRSAASVDHLSLADDKQDNYNVYCPSIAFLEENVPNAVSRFRKPRIFALPVFVRLFLSLPGWFSLL